MTLTPMIEGRILDMFAHALNGKDGENKGIILQYTYFHTPSKMNSNKLLHRFEMGKFLDAGSLATSITQWFGAPSNCVFMDSG